MWSYLLTMSMHAKAHTHTHTHTHLSIVYGACIHRPLCGCHLSIMVSQWLRVTPQFHCCSYQLSGEGEGERKGKKCESLIGDKATASRLLNTGHRPSKTTMHLYLAICLPPPFSVHASSAFLAPLYLPVSCSLSAPFSPFFPFSTSLLCARCVLVVSGQLLSIV